VAAGAHTGTAGCYATAASLFGTFKKQAAAASVSGKKAGWAFKTIDASNSTGMPVGYPAFAGFPGTYK